MKSLGVRLFTGVLVAVAAFWVVWLVLQIHDVARRQTGWIDSTLRDAASQILLSMPQDIHVLSAHQRFLQLPADKPFGGDKMSFQVWSVAARQLVLHSPGAPVAALKGDFVPGFTERKLDGVVWRMYAVSDVNGQIQVQVGKSLTMVKRDLLLINRNLAVATLIFLLLAVAVWWIIRWSLKPVTNVCSAIQQRGSADLTPLSAKGLPTEISPLIESFNRLMGRLDTSMQTERRFLADAAHELRTPLAALIVQAELALRADTREQAELTLRRLVGIARRGTRLSEQLLDMARLDAVAVDGPPVPIELHTLVMVLVRDVEAIAAQKQQRILLEARTCWIEGHVDPLGVLIRNLIDNALRYGGPGARIAVSCMDEPGADGMQVVFRVADDGPGVPEAEHERIFDRFYRVAGNTERGSGIGLSLVAQSARLHGALVEIGPGLDGRGLGVTVRFHTAKPSLNA